MKLPMLGQSAVNRDIISTFKGYHHRPTVPDGSFYEEMNLSSEAYPILTSRALRGIYKDGIRPSAMIYTDRLCYVDGPNVVYGDEIIECGLSTAPSMLPKMLISMGVYLIVFPDHYYVNTADTSDKGAIEERFSSVSEWGNANIYNHYEAAFCEKNGDDIAGANKFNWHDGYFKIKINNSADIETFKWFNDFAFQIGRPLKAEAISSYDGSVWQNFPGIPTGAFDTKTEYSQNSMGISIPVRTTYAGWYYDISKSVVYSINKDMIILQGYFQKKKTPYFMEKDPKNYKFGFSLIGDPIPYMDHVFEHENRLWGCRYGFDNFGKLVNEIYASALGSFCDFQKKEGVASDSFTQGVGSDGPFTGACSYNGYPYFFKEKGYHKVYGSYPEEYRTQWVECCGVEKGSHRSMAMLNGLLLYKGVGGVYSFDGNYPTELSYALGEESYTEAVAGAIGSKYYVSMKSFATRKRSLFVYDATLRVWHQEDDLMPVSFCSLNRSLYCIPSTMNRIIDMTGRSGTPEGAVSWSFETGMITCETVDRKYLQSISLRLSLPLDGVLYGQVEYDSSGSWEQILRLSGTSANTFTLPIVPQRCDHFRLKFSGTGDVKLFALAKSYAKGSAY